MTEKNRSHLVYKLIDVWGQVLSWGNPPNWLKAFISIWPLCGVLLSFIKENSYLDRYVLPNINSVWAAWAVYREWSLQTLQCPHNPILHYVSHYTGAWSVSFVWVRIHIPQQLQNGLLSS